MTVYLLAGGGTAGHVNPLLATAAALREREPSAEVVVVGTVEGLESRLVPERGLELIVVPRLPFPRSLSFSALLFPVRFLLAGLSLATVIRQRHVDVVVGFGGYAAAPAYLAARIARVPVVVHEANAIPGVANRWASRFARSVAVAFRGTPLPRATLVGMPMNATIALLDRNESRAEAFRFFGLDPARPVLLVTGGSTGARRINETIRESIRPIIASGWQVVHTVGESREFVDPEVTGYRSLRYCDRMDLAYAVSDVVIARSGAATVSELAGLGIPAIFVPYPVGNGEQARNAEELIAAGGALVCRDADFTPQFISDTVIPLLADASRRRSMSAAAQSLGIRDGAHRLAELVSDAVPVRGTVR
jgi:UDP-N-acetylglucosamine--N-acetylmuramyl-(pentapeptide) pyrophosphoryl-undecaprenol N-acetylglucosamine transferase